jgi:CorA-like Mg2+ transporter protein
MAFFAMEDCTALTRPDLIRMGIGNEPGSSSELPYSESYLEKFEERFCNDRYGDARLGSPSAGTRFMCTGRTLVVVGHAKDGFFMDGDGGFLGRFRHQHFLLFLVAHFHRASLHMFSDRLVAAVSRLEVGDVEADRVFRRDIRQAVENFLRFEHRYWFHEISNQAQARELFQLTRQHLDLDGLYREIREELQDMGNFLEVEAMRRQNDTVVRLTVVTTFGLIGTVTTGFLGMNILAWAEQPTGWRVAAFGIILGATAALTLYTVVKSRRLSELLATLSDEQVGWRQRLKASGRIWLADRDGK